MKGLEEMKHFYSISPDMYARNKDFFDYVVDKITTSQYRDILKIEKAIELVNKGAKLIGANPDITGPTEKGIMPATGALVAPIEIATGKIVYENAEQRKHNRYTRELRELCDKLKDGIPIEQLVDFSK